MNIKSFVLIGITIIALLLAGCKKNITKKETSFMEKIEEVTRNYVKTELKIKDLDSVKVVKIDTINRNKYTTVVLDILQKMYSYDLANYQSALEINDSINMNKLEIEINEIEQASLYYEDVKKQVPENDKNIFLYLVTANYYAKNNIDQFYFFATPDFKIFILDPFDTSILEK